MKIEVSFKKKWGKDLFYPLSADAVFLTKLTGRPTLLKNQLVLCADKGWKVKITQDAINVDKILSEKRLT